MDDITNLILKSIFVDNMVYTYFLGMCSYLAVSKKLTTANGLGIAVIFVLTFTAPLNWLIQENILIQGNILIQPILVESNHFYLSPAESDC